MSFIEEFVSGTSPGISADILNEPFHIRSATYQASPSQINVTIGPGRIDFSKAGDAWTNDLLTENFGTQTLTISNPTASTTYYIFLGKGAGGILRYSTDSTLFGNEVRLGYVQAGNPVSNPPSHRDMRSMMSPARMRAPIVRQNIRANYGLDYGFNVGRSDSIVVITYSGTAYETVPQMAALQLVIDYGAVTNSNLFFNNVQQHLAFPTRFAVFDGGEGLDRWEGGDWNLGGLSAGRHVSGGQVWGCVIDGSDWLHILVVEYPTHT